MSKSKDQAQKIVDKSKELGWDVSVNREVLVIEKRIENSLESFTKADSEYWTILGLLPATRPGSTWGTDGGGVGAIAAMNTGIFTMKKSGGDKRVLKALEKLI